MNGAQELGTAIANNIDITIVILNDNCYGMIKWKCALPSAAALPGLTQPVSHLSASMAAAISCQTFSTICAAS
jgi:thiamine pyrophosphate-dependent acetolactate synthase large subunit-like protein